MSQIKAQNINLKNSTFNKVKSTISLIQSNIARNVRNEKNATNNE